MELEEKKSDIALFLHPEKINTSPLSLQAVSNQFIE
jgi:hypothetical protein